MFRPRRALTLAFIVFPAALSGCGTEKFEDACPPGTVEEGKDCVRVVAGAGGASGAGGEAGSAGSGGDVGSGGSGGDVGSGGASGAAGGGGAAGSAAGAGGSPGSGG